MMAPTGTSLYANCDHGGAKNGVASAAGTRSEYKAPLGICQCLCSATACAARWTGAHSYARRNPSLRRRGSKVVQPCSCGT